MVTARNGMGMILLVMAFPCFLSAADSINIKKLEGIKEAVEDAIEKKKIPGAVVLVLNQGKVVYKQAFGNKSVDPRGSETQSTANYDDLYADPVLWMDQKWIDYILPQLYWSMNNPRANYSKLVKWWAENSNNTAVYIGHASYKIRGDADKSWNFATEIPNQVDFARSFKNVSGSAYFSSKWFMGKNFDVVRHLEENQYKYPALPAAVRGSDRCRIRCP